MLAKGKPIKDHGNHPAPKVTFDRQQGKKSIIDNVVDKILLNETQKVSCAREEPELLDSYYDENDIYQVEK